MNKAVIICLSSSVSTGDDWKVPVSILLVFLNHLIARDATVITFSQTTCPDCFEGRKLGVYA